MKPIIFLISIICLLSTISCEKKENSEQPELPPSESLILDFSDFLNAYEAPSNQDNEFANNQNRLHAFVDVEFWNQIVSSTMIVPTAAYLKAFDYLPEYLGDNQWKWEYEYMNGSDSYKAKIIAARTSSKTLKIQLYITQHETNEYTEFKWIEGIVNEDISHVEWTVYEGPDYNSELLRVEWNKNWEQNNSEITYTYIKPDTQKYGSSIHFELNNSKLFNAIYTLSDNSNTIIIEWNMETKEGRIKDEIVFGNLEWNCWNASGNNVECD